jgi:CubicO group peptidase (beta-lactamase class C family)
MRRPRSVPFLVVLAGLAGCAVASGPASLAPHGAPEAQLPDRSAAAAPESVGLSPDLPERIDSLLRSAIAEGVAPGAAVAVGRRGRLVHLAGYGAIDTPADAPAVDPSKTLFDLASLTKVVATTTAAMLLEDRGLLDLDRPVREYLPELSDPAKAAITPRMLLVHTGGLEAFAPLYHELRGREAYLAAINERPLRAAPGTTTVYSDWDFVLLQLIIERITGEPLDEFVAAHVFLPLGMTSTGYRPDPSLKQRIAATEVQGFRGGKVHGEVHDENAWALGGVAGHAGLFSTARDLAIFARMMLNGGRYGELELLRPATVARWTARQDRRSSRALGWDTPSPRSSAGRHFSPWSFGHTGFTGTSIWMDPTRELFVVLLTNRVNPTRDNPRAGPLRRALADLLQASVVDAPLHDWESRD